MCLYAAQLTGQLTLPGGEIYYTRIQQDRQILFPLLLPQERWLHLIQNQTCFLDFPIGYGYICNNSLLHVSLPNSNDSIAILRNYDLRLLAHYLWQNNPQPAVKFPQIFHSIDKSLVDGDLAKR